MVGRWRGAQPAANVSMITMRAPQHGQASSDLPHGVVPHLLGVGVGDVAGRHDDGTRVRTGIDRGHTRALPPVEHRGHSVVQFIDEIGYVVVGVPRHGAMSNRRTARSLPWRLALKSRLRQQSIPVGDMDALQCFELFENRPRNCAIEAPLFVT
jgi:hypothetical protein